MKHELFNRIIIKNYWNEKFVSHPIEFSDEDITGMQYGLRFAYTVLVHIQSLAPQQNSSLHINSDLYGVQSLSPVGNSMLW
jgi:hypothetical protein